MPNVILEALYLRCLTVAFDVGGIPEIISHNQDGLLAKENDIHDMARLIDLGLRDDPLRNRLCENGYRKITNSFLNEIRADKVFHVYKDMINDGHLTR